MSISRQVRKTRHAISPRLATSTRGWSLTSRTLRRCPESRMNRSMPEPSLLTEHSVAGAARAAGLPGEAMFVASTGPTNADLVKLAERDAPAWTMIVAGHQEAGRGRLGRGWDAPPGSSLLVSVLLRPAVDPADAPLLTLATALAAADACHRACGVAPDCKWPNDLLVG